MVRTVYHCGCGRYLFCLIAFLQQTRKNMKAVNAIEKKIFTLPQLLAQLAAWRVTNKNVAFTNGCFDILHEGHIFSLSQAAQEADYLVVGVNSDSSTKRLKGPERPVNHEHSRALCWRALLL
jgi:cytidyltransferase-like protein